MADNRLAYGIAKGLGIDTTDMSPKEVWEAIAKKKDDGREVAETNRKVGEQRKTKR